MKKLLEATSRDNMDAHNTQRKREYFVHKCIKILAKRKRGNKFAYGCTKGIGQVRKRQGKEQKRKQIQAF